jgi:GMP synthase (glutamine-hydrolysing)
VSLPLLIVKTGTTLPTIRDRRGDFEDWIAARLGWPSKRVRVSEVYQSDSAPERLPDPGDVAGIVLTGSGAMVSHREAWSEATASWLASLPASQTPCLGICYGHQLLAHALGGSVGPTPGGREMGTLEVELQPSALRDDPLLGDLPPVAPLQVTHVESVLELPDGARRLARTALDANHAFRLGTRIWGIQFHPEFDADVMHSYIEGRREILEGEGFDPDAMRSQVRETPHGDEILRRFGKIAAERQIDAAR